LVAMPPKGRVVAGQVDDTLFGNPNEHALRKVRTRPVELRSVGVVGAQELQGMATRAWAGPQDRRSMGSGGEERQRLKALSDARKAKWPNTLEALRAKKERARQEKAAADEAVRMALDREEDALQAEKRRVAIERANKMIYDATDRVKALHSRLRECDAVTERQRQIELKKRIIAERDEEAKWFQLEQEAIRRFDAAEDAKLEEEAAKKAALAKVREEQLAGRNMERAAEQRVREEETEMMRTLVLENFEAEKRERVHKVERREAEKRELIESNRALLELRAKEAALVEQEEAMISVYKEKKERNVQQRREKEAAMFKAKQEQRQHLIDTQSAQLAAMTSDAEARLDAQMAEVENKASEARARKEEKRKDDLLIMHMSRQRQIRWKAEKRLQEEADSRHLAESQAALNRELQMEEDAELRAVIDRRKEYDKVLQAQMAQKRERKAAEEREDLVIAEMSRQFNGDDDEIYEQYAQMCLDEYVAAGKELAPAKLYLAKELKKDSILAN